MGNRLRTSLHTKKVFDEVKNISRLQPFALSKIALALSLRMETPLSEEDFNTDNDGLELSRETVCGPYDSLFCMVVCEDAGKAIADSEIFSTYFKAHIDRGAKELEKEFHYDKRLFRRLIGLKDSI